LLATKKANRDNAIAFLTYLISHLSKSTAASSSTSSTLSSKGRAAVAEDEVAQLAWLQFSVQKVLRHILWYNQDNYYIEEDGHEQPLIDDVQDRGITETKSVRREEALEIIVSDKENSRHRELIAPVCRYRWLLAEATLPLALQTPFYAIVRTFMAHLVQQQDHHIRKVKQTKVLQLANGLTAPMSGGLFSDPLDGDELEEDLDHDGLENETFYKEPFVIEKESALHLDVLTTPDTIQEQQEVQEEGSKTLPQEMTLKLFKLVQEVQAHYYKETKKSSVSSTAMTTKDVPLAFIQLVTALIVLDPSFEIHGRALRKQWLHMSSIPEFAPNAAFSPLVPILILPAPPCPHCLSTGPYRHMTLYSRQELCQFSCQDCEQDLPLSLIAQQIQATIGALFISHLNQDAICRHCRLPKEFPCLTFCPHCKGEPYMTPPSSLPETIQLLRQLSWLPLHDYFDTRFVQ
jgi:hypothetical protein